MSLMKLLSQAQGGQGLAQLAQQFNMDPAQAEGLAKMLAPAIGSAAKERATRGGAEGLLGSLMGEGNAQLFDDPAQAASTQGRAQGQAFLEQLMGGQAETEALASEAANRAGVDAGTVAQFLPALAGMLQGGMQKNMPDIALQSMMGQVAGGGAAKTGGLGGLLKGLLGGGRAKQADASPLSGLMNMLDADGDGSPLDDILGKLMK